jgi:glycosyltransferase involved in cell wall biosynthesis
MRLAINGFFHDQQATGSGQYTRQLVQGLGSRAQRPHCLLMRPHWGKPEARSETDPSKVVERFLKPPVFLGQDLAKVWFEQISFPRACLAEKVDVAHVPYFAPPFLASDRTVVTIHDLIPLVLPSYDKSVLVRLYTRFVASAAKRASAIITDSFASQRDILRLLGVSPDLVHAIYLAVDNSYRRMTDLRELQQIRRKYGLPEDYVLYLGGFDQRKNLSTLVIAYGALQGELAARTPLVIAGRLPSHVSEFFPDPRAAVQRAGLEDRVLFIGWVPEHDKPALYSGAALFVFPSLYEGFGLPVLEAMSCGTAVVTSDRASLPEIVGDGAILVDPLDSSALAAAMTDLLRDPAKRGQLAERGLSRAKLFSWEETLCKTIAVYESVADRSGSV